MVDLGVLPQDRALIPRLLHPLDGAVARAGDRAGIGTWPRAGGNQYRIITAPRRVNRAAVIQRADIDVNRGRLRLIPDHGAAQSRVESDALVRHRDEFWRRPTFFLRLGHALLP